MCVKALHIIALLSGLAAPGVLLVNGMRIYTPGDVEAVNGTDVRLKCTFESSVQMNPNAVTISWSFRPLSGGKEFKMFHYQNLKPYPPKEGIFKKHISWAGDVYGSDASIIIREVKFIYNGTYSCHVINPPDYEGVVGEIKLRVVKTASFSELLFLVLAIGGGIAAVIFCLIVIVSCRRCKNKYRQRQQEGDEEEPIKLRKERKERKDPTACHPSKAIHLYLSETSIEIDSSDGMISDPSTGGPSSSEEDDPESDEEDIGGDSD